MIKTKLRPSDVFEPGMELLLIMFLLIIPVLIGFGSITIGILVGDFELAAGGAILLFSLFLMYGN